MLILIFLMEINRLYCIDFRSRVMGPKHEFFNDYNMLYFKDL